MILLGLSALLALAVFLLAILSGKQHDDLVLAEWHHEYLGLIVQAIAAALYALAPWTWLQFLALLFVLAGNIIQWDDSCQHAAQRWTKAGHQHRSAMWYFWQALNE